MIHKTASMAVQSFYNDRTPEITPIEIVPGEGIAVGFVILEKSPTGGCITKLHNDVRKEYMEKWNNDVGYLMRKDFKHGIYTGYSKMLMGDIKMILREIKPDEEEYMKSRGFVHLKTVDKKYTIIKMCDVNESWDSYGKIEIQMCVYDNSQYSTYETKTEDNNENIDTNQLF